MGISRAKDVLNEFPHQLSGGMRQRVMIAMALSCDPELLIADEPTTALDVTIQAQILELMKELQAELGMSILLITHDLGVVSEMCDRVAVMYAGQIVEEASVKALFQKPMHPYTKGLIASVPQMGKQQSKLSSIPGNVPHPTHMPSGCRFAPRCSYAFDQCISEEPPLIVTEEGHKSACWLHETSEYHLAKGGEPVG